MWLFFVSVVVALDRDPHVERTIGVFRGAARWVAEGRFAQNDVSLCACQRVLDEIVEKKH